MESETLKALQKLKVDCMYTQGNHFNAARRLHKESKWFRYGLVIGSCCTALAAVMNLGVWTKIPGDTLGLQIFVNLLGALGAFFVLYATTFASYYNKMEEAVKHDRIGVELNLIFKIIRNTEAAYKDHTINDEILGQKLDNLTNRYAEIIKNAPITIDADYKQTQANFEAGNREYTDKELNA